MSHARRSCLITVLRVFVLALFVSGLVVQPVLASLGELHELAHDPSGLHSHSVQSDHSAMPSILSSQQPQAAARTATLHMLLHFAHCCAQSSVVMTTGLAFVAGVPTASQPTEQRAQVVLPTRPMALFRPPIPM
ncbi:MAG TPA: hypothetical protein VLZ76_07825 [Lysobacter sp.]|jgi:hypothetical protein|nr:hypothetical protein [Lysobacter sp.]